MRRLLIIPGLLFGLVFAGGGFFIAAETVWPMWQNWQQVQNWRPASARILSVEGSGNDTRASYRYEYTGGSFQGSRVGLAPFKDNIGSYHGEMQAKLRRVKRNNDMLPIWVNPANPAEAIIDRNMRWGLFALTSAFCSVFLLIGLGVVYASIRGAGKVATRRRPSLWEMRKSWKQAQNEGRTDLAFVEFCQQHYADSAAADTPGTTVTPPTNWRSRKGWEAAEIKSDAARGTWFLWIFALVWNAVSTPLVFVLPDEISGGNHAALIGLLFPLIGLFLAYKAIVKTLEYRRFGRVLLNMDPFPGAIGGHVGGLLQVKNLDYRAASDTQTLSVKLECVHSYVSGSGDSRSRRETIKWAEQGQPQINKAQQGVNLVFRFNVPEHLPQADVEQSGSYHFWRLSVNADIPGIDLDRSYNIPVFATAETSRHSHHDISAQAAGVRKQESDAARIAISSGKFDIDGLSRSLRLRNEGDRILLRFPMFRNKVLTLFAAIFAGGFSFACYSMSDMASGGGLFGVFIIIFAIPFLLVALFASIAALYLPFNNLRVIVQPGTVSILRRWLFIPIFRRVLQRDEIAHLAIKRSGSTGQGVDKIEHYKIRAEDRRGRKVTLAEDIDGEDVATHFRDYLAQRIGAAVK